MEHFRRTYSACVPILALKFSPDLSRRVLSFGVGRIAGGLVSVIGSVLDPSPVAKEIHWGAVVSGRPVRYVVLTQ